MKIVVQNSFSKFSGVISPDADSLMKQLLTYKNEIGAEKGMLFNRMKYYKRVGQMQKYHAAIARVKKLDATEIVCLYKDGSFPTGLLNIVVEGLKVLNIEFSIEDQRKVPTQDALLRWNNKPWEPRYYQKEMIEVGLKHGRGVFQAAVGSGKSLVMAYLIKELAVTTLIIVPSKGLSSQLYNDFSAWFGDRNVDVLDAQKVRKLKKMKPISIITIQSCASLKKSGEFKKLAENVQSIHIDEVHHSGSSSYFSLLEDLDHVFYRFGYSGTFLRNDSKTLDMWSFMSNVLFNYPAHQAIKDGFLTPMEVLTHKLDGRSSNNYKTEYDRHYSGNAQLLQRIYEITQIDQNAQILVLVSLKDKCGKIIHEYLNTLGVPNKYLSGDDSIEDIDQGIEDFNDKKLRILVGSSVFGEGRDIRSTDHLIMAQGGKSQIVMVQAAGRLVRLYEGKLVGYLHDFKFENTRYMSKHLTNRLDTYKRNFECPIRYV